MAQTITKLSIEEFQEFRIVQRLDEQDQIETVLFVGYKVPTDDGDVIRRSREIILGGVNLTRAEDMFTDIEASLKTSEGIP